MPIKPYFKRPDYKIGPHTTAALFPGQVAAAYSLPKITGVTVDPLIAIVELGGGHSVQDIKTAFATYGLPEPTIDVYLVDGAKVADKGDDANAEVMLDLLVAAAIYSWMTGRSAHVALIYCPNSDTGFAHGVDKGRQLNAATVSISWGQQESGWSASGRQLMSTAFAALNAIGSVAFASSGDNDFTDGGQGANVDYPASDSVCIGCGGTTLSIVNGVPSEKVWNDGSGTGSGGGYSVFFKAPAWQIVPGGRGRMVPDIAGNADPATGWKIMVDGQWAVIGGTSAVSPMYAGIFAALKAGGADLTNLAAKIYANPKAFRDITSGDNGFYKAATGVDPCTGNGTPNGPVMAASFIVMGPPPPPPPPGGPPQPPPVSTVTEAQIIAVIDTRFVYYESRFPLWLKPTLQSINKDLDAVIHQVFAKSSGHTEMVPSIDWSNLLAILEQALVDILRKQLIGQLDQPATNPVAEELTPSAFRRTEGGLNVPVTSSGPNKPHVVKEV